MSIPKTFLFADGENMVMRFQAMTSEGRRPKEDVIHIKDVFVWHPDVTKWSVMDVQRVTYYSSATGDQQKIADIKAKIAGVSFDYEHEYGQDVPVGSAQIVPRIYHKAAQSRKTRNVDINIIIDMLRVAHLPSTELLILLSGDGDYLPVIEECMRLGKPVWVCSFSSGCHKELPYAVDLHVDLDEMFFESD
jgi:uncharacterized LabA/DUF88 family protein